MDINVIVAIVEGVISLAIGAITFFLRRTINILRYDYKKLREIEYALPDMEHGEIVDSVNYLAECGYIRLRHVVSQRSAALSDTRWEEIEAKLTADGIRLLAGCRQDECVEV